MAAVKNPRDFFERGTAAQFEFVLSIYEEALKLKAEQKNKRPEELQKLDTWYRLELPERVKSRLNEPHLTHEELVQCMKWKLARGKWRPRLKELVQMNTPRLVLMESKKAFRQILKRNDLSSAIQALCNLKGVGPAMASAILAAGFPEKAPFMADECLLAIPDFEGIDYTINEYLKFVERVQNKVNRLNEEVGEPRWTPHRLEQALWSHYVTADLKPALLDDMPEFPPANGDTKIEDHSEKESQKNGNLENDQSNDSCDGVSIEKEDSSSNLSAPVDNSSESNVDLAVSEDLTETHNTNGTKHSLEPQASSQDELNSEPVHKKLKVSE